MFARRVKKHQGGFTLLELLVVVAILALVAGGLLVAYDGMEAKAAKGQATFNLAAVDKGVRAFKVVTGAMPNELDSLLTDGLSAVTCAAGTSCTATAATAAGPGTAGSGFYAGLHSNLQGSDGSVLVADGKLGLYALTAADVTSLANAGITSLRYVDDAINAVGTIPNRDFDDLPRGKGLVVSPLVAGSVVPVVESEGLGAATVCTAPFSSACNRLNDITGLNPAIGHIVVATGLGNNSSIISDATGANAAHFSEAPFYTDVAKNQYGRFLTLFHLASDLNDDADFDDAGERLTTARFVGVIDSKGDWLDEEYAEFTGQKP